MEKKTMLSRGFMGVIAIMGLLIALGLVVTHSSGTAAVSNSLFSGIDMTIRDLSLQPAAKQTGH